jgi:hypothetical protein
LVIKKFRAWWQSPATPTQRLGGAVSGFIGFLALGILGRLFLGARPVGIVDLVYWGAGASVVGVAVGLRYPKAMTCVIFPLTFVAWLG